MIASVLIVNYNSGRDLAGCLAALQRQSVPRQQFEIILVDNASRDDSLCCVPKDDPQLQLIRLNRNVGFAEANNIAARHARADVLVLLNPDTRPDPFWLEELLATMRERAADVAVSKLVFADEPTRINSAGLMLLRDGRGVDRGFRQRDVGQFECEQPVFAGCGAALAVRRPRLGDLLRSDLFLYYEDLDLAWRRQAAGLTVWYAPRSLVLHAVGASEFSPIHRFYVERNRVLTALRYADLPLALYSVLSLAAKVPLAMIRWAAGTLPMATALAVPKALLAVLGQLPELLVQRYVNRAGRLR